MKKVKGEEKTYQLSNEEMGQIMGRKRSVQYFAALVETDIAEFVDEVVKPRLGLKSEDLIEISLETGKAVLKVTPNDDAGLQSGGKDQPSTGA